MTDVVIANPPIGIYTNIPIHVGHAYYLTLLDVNARFISTFLNKSIYFPTNSFNLFGKRGDKLFQEEGNSISKTSLKLEKRISEDLLRTKLNLLNDDMLLDTNDFLIDSTQDSFLRLFDKGYLLEKQNKYFLDCKKISENYNLKSYLDLVSLNNKQRNDFLFLLTNNVDDVIEITKPTLFSVPNPIRYGENIGPLFHLANLWDGLPKYDSLVMAASNGVRAKYVLLRFLSKIVLDDNPGFDELIVWPKIHFAEKKDEFSLEDSLKNPSESDLTRLKFMLTHSNNVEHINISNSQDIFSKKLFYLVNNLKKPIKTYSVNVCENDSDDFLSYKRNMSQFKYKLVLNSIFMDLKNLSKRVNLNRENSSKVEEQSIKKEYLKNMRLLEPFIPYTIKKISKEIE